MKPKDEGTCFPHPTKKRSLPSIFEDQFDSEYSPASKLESADKEERSGLEPLASELTERGSGFPGFGYPAGVPLVPADIFQGNGFGIGQRILEKYQPKLKSRRSVSCQEEDLDQCCGCTSMDIAYKNFEDKPNCDTCNQQLDGDWPGNVFDQRDLSTGEGDDNEYHHLDKRVPGKASDGHKKISACKMKTRTYGQNNYPSFPSKASWPWDGIENNAWNGISAYWGNSTDFCSDWSVSRTVKHDTTRDASGFLVRANYQSMFWPHV